MFHCVDAMMMSVARVSVSEAGKRVTQVFREEAPLARVLPPYLAEEAARRLRATGVELLPHGG